MIHNPVYGMVHKTKLFMENWELVHNTNVGFGCVPSAGKLTLPMVGLQSYPYLLSCRKCLGMSAFSYVCKRHLPKDGTTIPKLCRKSLFPMQLWMGIATVSYS